MSQIKPAWANVELDDGTLLENMRIIYADRVGADKTSRARKWKAEEAPTRHAGLLAWLAATRLGIYTLDYEAFVTSLVDVQLTDDPPEDEPTTDPTNEAASAASS